jgi:hypothetical protein
VAERNSDQQWGTFATGHPADDMTEIGVHITGGVVVTLCYETETIDVRAIAEEPVELELAVLAKGDDIPGQKEPGS